MLKTMLRGLAALPLAAGVLTLEGGTAHASPGTTVELTD